MARTKTPLLSAPPYPVEAGLRRLGSNLRTARLARNLRLDEVAEKIGTGRRAVALACGDQGRRANVENLLSQCGRFLLAREAAARILDEMETQVRARWYEVARREGVSERDCERIAGAFAYGGFRYT